MISASFTFYTAPPNGTETTWGTTLPAPPRVGDSVHPGDELGDEYRKCWNVFHVSWVRIDQEWTLEIAVTDNTGDYIAPDGLFRPEARRPW